MAFALVVMAAGMTAARAERPSRVAVIGATRTADTELLQGAGPIGATLQPGTLLPPLTAPLSTTSTTTTTPPDPGAQVTAPPPDCPAAACVVVDATDARGTASQRAQGFVAGLTASTPAALLTALAPTSWRFEPYATERFALARAAGGPITLVLSDAWEQKYSVRGKLTRNPWDDWNAYADFVRTTVGWHATAGELPDYWDIQNEPEALSSYATRNGPTRGRVLQQFQVAYKAIKDVLPDAKVVGPSLGNARIDDWTQLVDLRSLLADAATHGIHYDAISWHENGDAAPGSVQAGPRSIVGHVRAVQALLAQYPTLGDPPLVINEYGAPNLQGLAGAEVGYLAELERAGVLAADHSCFPMSWYGSSIDTCADARGVLDGLLTPDGHATSSWWVHRDYASMRGTRVAADGTTAALEAYATVETTGAVDLLVGSEPACELDAYLGSCASATGPTLTPVLTLAAPAGAPPRYTAEIQLLPHGSAALDTPSTITRQVDVVNGQVELALPTLPGGDAMFVTLVPA